MNTTQVSATKSNKLQHYQSSQRIFHSYIKHDFLLAVWTRGISNLFDFVFTQALNNCSCTQKHRYSRLFSSTDVTSRKKVKERQQGSIWRWQILTYVQRMDWSSRSVDTKNVCSVKQVLWHAVNECSDHLYKGLKLTILSSEKKMNHVLNLRHNLGFHSRLRWGSVICRRIPCA